MAVIAQAAIKAGKQEAFYIGKVMQARYFIGTTLPLTMARLDTCVRNGREIVEMPAAAF